MISFDFLHAAQPALIRKVAQWRMPPEFYAPAAALCGVLLATAGACGIEESRLHSSLAMESAYRARYEQSRTQLQSAGIELRRIREIIELDDRVRRMTVSGYRNAERLAGIANALPSHAWLTSIAYDGEDIVLKGRASGLPAVGAVLRGIERSRGLGEPALESTTLDDGANSVEKMLYTVRLRRAGR